MKRIGILLIGVLLSAPSGAQTTESTRVKSGHDLVRRIEGARLIHDCGVMLEWGYTYPIPASDGGTKCYKVLFYPIADRPKASERVIGTPRVLAFFPLAGKPQPTCKAIKERGKVVGPRYSAAAERIVTAERDDALHGLVIEVAQLYFRGGKMDSAGRALVSEFYKEFQLLKEPGFDQYYYDLNPDFWKWVEQITGKRFLPKKKK